MSSEYGVIVVGAGHAGCEAAAAAARMGERVALVTLSKEMVGEMPCNPAIGGVGKGHLVAEIDALGGVQAWAADRAGIHFKMLNSSKGSAVWGPRAQCDKERYRKTMRRLMTGMSGVELIQDEVVGVLLGDGAVIGVRSKRRRAIRAPAVIITTGTFMDGVLHTGMEQEPGGRRGEKPSVGLGDSLREAGLQMRRYKTGTPPRIMRSSIATDRLEVQEGDRDPRPFSWRTRRVSNRETCWLARTTEEVRRIIEDNLDSSPLYTGRIKGIGPRYCPSIEDKVVRFPHHRTHTVFLEPEGIGSESVYLNGLSTSLAKGVQERLVRAVPGMERARFLRYGYAVEYDVVAPGQVTRTLRSREVRGLYLAGQALGTSGYEEAAALGLLAGIYAVQETRGEETVEIGREDGYIGVMVDDLVTKEHEEPYRMLTARAEHRLLFGIDSARERLMERGARLGLVPQEVFHVEQRRWQRLREIEQKLDAERPQTEEAREIMGEISGGVPSWAGLLRRRDSLGVSVRMRAPYLSDLEERERETVVERIRYRGYIERHQRERERVQRLREVELPFDLGEQELPGLSREVQECLRKHKPRSLAEAEGLPGVTPAALAIIAGMIARGRREG